MSEPVPPKETSSLANAFSKINRYGIISDSETSPKHPVAFTSTRLAGR